MITTVNDLIGLNYANLRNPQPVNMAPGLSYKIDPTAQGGRRLVGATPTQIPRANLKISPSNLMPDPEFPEYAQSINTKLTPLSDVNQQPVSLDTIGIAPLLQQEMPLDYEEMIQEDKSIVPQKSKGLNSLFQLALSAVVPGAGLIMGGARGLAGLNRRVKQNVTDFFDRRKYGGRTRDQAYADMITQTRGIQKQMALRPSGQITQEDKYRGGASSTNEAASRSASKASAQKASRSAGTSSARGSNYGTRFHG